jgi:cyanophycinase
MVVTNHREFTVRGTGAVFVVDCTTAVTDAADARAGAPMLVSGATVHTLPSGATFDLTARRLTGFVEQHPDLLVSIAAAKA